MNMNELAKVITKLEGKKESVSIAQVKEILKIIVDLLSEDFIKYSGNSKAKCPISECVSRAIESTAKRKVKKL